MEIVAEGLLMPEGPVWMKDGSVIVVEVGAGVLTRIWPDGRKECVAECGGGPNGAAIGPDGWLYVCNNGGLHIEEVDGKLHATGAASLTYNGGWIDRIHPTSGKVERLYEECEGRRLAGPNDIVFDYEGGMWFSDFGKDLGYMTENGGIYYAKPDGSLIKRAIDGGRVNGVGLSPDRKTLYGALSFESLVVAFAIEGPGELRGAGMLVGEPVGQLAARQIPDSLAVTEDGHICVATCMTNAGVASISPVTGEVRNFPFPDPVTTNICFGGPDMQDAWVTLTTSGRLARVRWERPGLRLAYYA